MSRKQGRPYKKAGNPLGRLIQDICDEKGLRQYDVAAALGISKSALTRLISGKPVHGVVAESLIRALQVRDDATKREIECLFLDVSPSPISPQSERRKRDWLLDLLNGKIEQYEKAITQGRSSEVHEDIKIWFDRLREISYDIDIDIVLIGKCIHIGILLGVTSEQVLPYPIRFKQAANIYMEVETLITTAKQNRLYEGIRNDCIRDEALLLSLQAQLYQQGGLFPRSEKKIETGLSLANSLKRETYERLIIGLNASLYRIRSHNFAIQGQEQQWKEALMEHKKFIERYRDTPLYEGLVFLYNHIVGEDCKRLGFYYQEEWRKHKKYMLRAYATLKDVYGEEPKIWGDFNHPMRDISKVYILVSMAQCLVLIYPDHSASLIKQARVYYKEESTLLSIAKRIEYTDRHLRYRDKARPIYDVREAR